MAFTSGDSVWATGAQTTSSKTASQARTSLGLPFTETARAGTVAVPTVLTAADAGIVNTNTGAQAKVGITLPSAAAAAGLFAFINTAAIGMRISAPAGQTIRIIDAVSASGGYIEPTRQYATLLLLPIGATEWMYLAGDLSWLPV